MWSECPLWWEMYDPRGPRGRRWKITRHFPGSIGTFVANPSRHKTLRDSLTRTLGKEATCRVITYRGWPRYRGCWWIASAPWAGEGEKFLLQMCDRRVTEMVICDRIRGQAISLGWMCPYTGNSTHSGKVRGNKSSQLLLAWHSGAEVVALDLGSRRLPTL